ncbi:MAG TPA: glycosyltransferase family 4 protein [Rhodanobacteraceae bacterium]|nr:glycosyltransferase family 4 protein [Rhodanobacteraceae bacterium]
MHVAQLNLLPAPPELPPQQLLERWHSLPDIAEVVANAGVRVSVLQAAARDAQLTRNGIDYRFIGTGSPATGLGRGAWGRRFADVLAGIGADVVHVHGLQFAGVAAQIGRSLPRLPILLQDHANRPPRGWLRWRWRRWFAAAAGIAFTSRAQARPFMDAGLLGSRTVLFGIPESSSRFTPGTQAAARAETGLHGNPCVLWVGHLAAGKDPLSVLDGVAHASSRLPDLHLWCAFGTAPLLQAVRQRIRGDPRLAGRVHLLGPVAHAHIQTLLRASDLFVSGSRAESCGFALLEALACGVPPVVTDIPAFRALTGNGRVGALWPCGDAARLAEALVQAAGCRPPAAQVRAHFDAALSFTALGRRWSDAYARTLDAHSWSGR